MELAVLTLFAVLLIGALAAGVPILYALIAGLILFSAYSLKCGFTLEQTGKMCLKGVNTVKNVLITMTIIGVLTGLWRSSGTIPAIVGYCVQLITPSVFLLLTFLLNSLVSFLIGTSFGTAATMGAICIAMAQAMDISLALAGGAAISGAFFGDRCSPVSTSTLLVAEVTHTDMYKNIPKLRFYRSFCDILCGIPGNGMAAVCFRQCGGRSRGAVFKRIPYGTDPSDPGSSHFYFSNMQSRSEKGYGS